MCSDFGGMHHESFDLIDCRFFVFIVDVVYGNHSYARFYMLETIARVP
ncbi:MULTISPECIES: hypothetical protein [unclassified Nostoc]|nr:hypothetical protein [Nostoc sp. JL23]MBN3877531.1 hypothetical protein [Nostoc sp. JL23]